MPIIEQRPFLVVSLRPNQEPRQVQSLAQGHFNTWTGEVRDHTANTTINGRPALPLSHILKHHAVLSRAEKQAKLNGIQ